MDQDQNGSALNRRNLLKGASLAGAAALGTQVAAEPPAAKPAATAKTDGAGPNAIAGGDYMVDVLKSLKLDYIVANPGSSFRGLHESLLNYGGNRAPEFITCMHEESSVAMAHGYAKTTGRPLCFLAHSTVGLQHASMALYNAWCDRVPVIGVLGNIMNAAARRPGIEWYHTAQDPCAMVRDYTKWDDQPNSLQHFGESLVRAYKIAMTPPMGPTIVVADGELQEMHMKDVKGDLHLPRLALPQPPQAEDSALRDAAKLLAKAERPIIYADRMARTPEGMTLLVQLAETLGCPVVDMGGRMNFPNNHPLSQNERGGQLLRQADVILALEVADLWGMTHEFIDNEEQTVQSKIRAGAKIISISSTELYLKSNYQDFQRYAEPDYPMAGDAQASLPSLIEFCKREIDDGARGRISKRAEDHAAAKAKAYEATRNNAAVAWNASPVSTARLAAEIWSVIKDEDWALVSNDALSGWARRLWTFNRHYRYIGGAGGGGVGYCLPASVGAALAHRGTGRIAINLQADGDMMYAPGALWTAVHHKVPLLTIMHNNRAYHQEIMHVLRMANRRDRDPSTSHIGTTIDNPYIDYATLAKSMGMYAEGPISDPAQVGKAIRRALEVVKQGSPALVDIVTQPR